MTDAQNVYTFTVERADIEPLHSLTFAFSIPDNDDDAETDTLLDWAAHFLRLRTGAWRPTHR